MKNYNEMANDVFRRIGEYETLQKNRRKVMRKIIIPVCSFCLVALFGIGMWSGNFFDNTKPIELNDSTIIGDKDYIEPETNNQSGGAGDVIAEPCPLYPLKFRPALLHITQQIQRKQQYKWHTCKEVIGKGTAAHQHPGKIVCSKAHQQHKHTLFGLYSAPDELHHQCHSAHGTYPPHRRIAECGNCRAHAAWHLVVYEVPHRPKVKGPLPPRGLIGMGGGKSAVIAEHKLLHSPHPRKVIWIVCKHVGNVAGNVYDYRYGNVKYTAPQQGKYGISLKVLYCLTLRRILGIAEMQVFPISPEQRCEKYHRKAASRVYAYPLAGGAKAKE